MPIRRVTNDLTRGYGSFGTVSLNSPLSTVVDIRNELPEIATLRPNDSTGNPAYAYIVQVLWRWKFALISAEISKTQRYNTLTGKTRFGTCVVSLDNYISADEFVSYSGQISRLYMSAFRVIAGISQDPDLPCDEPPSDTPIQIVQNAQWIAKSTATPNALFYTSTPDSCQGTIGDKVVFYPEAGVQSYIFGGSYSYVALVTYTQAEYELLGNVPVINL